jgi:hypothetical protein
MRFSGRIDTFRQFDQVEAASVVRVILTRVRSKKSKQGKGRSNSKDSTRCDSPEEILLAGQRVADVVAYYRV